MGLALIIIAVSASILVTFIEKIKLLTGRQ